MGAALLAVAKGYAVFVSDAGVIAEGRKKELETNNISFEEGGHSLDQVLLADLIIKSPGIPDTAEVVAAALDRGIPIINELEFAYRFTSKPIIAITGSNGKTTTTLLAHHILAKSGKRAGLAGNVGFSLARQVIKDEADIYVVEVSSFQLDGMVEFTADTAVLLNITPDHLDRYGYDFDRYANSKMRVMANMQDTGSIVYCTTNTEANDRVVSFDTPASKIPIGLENNGTNKGYLQDDILYYFAGDKEYRVPLEVLPLRGPHNYLNTLVAIAIAVRYGATELNIIQALPTFRNAPHRLEYIASIDGVDIINDSKATNVDSVVYALGSFDTEIVWIAGGQDKGNDYAQLKGLVNDKVKALICLGADNSRLYENFEPLVDVIVETQDVKEAARMALEYANKSDVILFSPACASFDLFNNYAERGDLFREAVLELKEEINA